MKAASLIALVVLAACATVAPQSTEAERNKEINRRFVQEIYNEQKLERIPLYVAPDFIDRSPGAPPEAKGPDYVTQQARGSFGLVPDLKMTVHHMHAEGDLVTIHWSGAGTSAAQGKIPAGKKVDFHGISVFRMRDGKIVESWDIVDRLTMFRQLGFTLTPPAAP
jgi:predicted ester cyclase